MWRNTKVRKDPLRVQKLVKSLNVVTPKESASSDYKKLAEKIPLYLSKSLAQETENNYFLAFQRFQKFCDENEVPSLPANPEDILVYFVKLSEESESAAGVLQARSAIRHYKDLLNSDHLAVNVCITLPCDKNSLI